MVSDATIGFLVKAYPKISETFILEELLGLERNGLRPHIFSMRQPTDAVCHDANRAVRAPVTYLPPTGVSNAVQGVRAHGALIVNRPRRYLQALVFVLRREEGGPAAERAAQAPCRVSERRLGEKKGFASLNEACRLLRDAGQVVRWKIVGYREQHGRLAALISRHGLNDAVQLAGKMTQDQLIDL